MPQAVRKVHAPVFFVKKHLKSIFSCKNNPMKIDQDSNQPTRIYLKDYASPAYQVGQIHLHFNLHETKTSVTARMTFKKIKDEPLVLHGENLILLSVRLNEKILPPSDFITDHEKLTVLQTPNEFTLETLVDINPEANKSCEGLYLSNGIFATQCEAESFRKITYFLDRPDVMTSYSVVIEADKKKYPYLLSNGDLIEKKDLKGGRHQATWKDPFKKPSYLFALVAGDLGVIEDSFTTKSGKKVKLEVFAAHGKQDRCHHAMQSLKKSMKWDEERFGLEYDLNQFMLVSIDDFNMGAMENKGLNIFNSRLVLADPHSATDKDFDMIEAVVGHEYFHNWTGNRVTCRNWFELSLKEGLTVFRDQEFTADLHSRAAERIKAVDDLRGRQFAEDAGPNSHPVRPESCLAVDNFYTSTIYEKGSEVIRMMQTIVGRKGFRKGMDEYFRRHDGEAVTIIDFANAISEPNQIDLAQFKLWYSQAGTPTVDVTESFDPAKKEYVLTLNQNVMPTEKQPSSEPFHIPLLIGLIDAKGNNIDLKCENLIFNSDGLPLIHFTEKQQRFVFKEIIEKPVLSLNRQFSAPIKLVWNASQSDLLHLIKYDSDEFNRREANYKMSLEELRRLVHDQKSAANALVVEAWGFILNDKNIDPQFKALMLQLPNENVLAQEETILDAQAFESAYNRFFREFVNQYKNQILALYQKHSSIDTAPDRALKGRLLKILIEGNFLGADNLAYKQFLEAENMTDKLGAMAALCQTASSLKDEALDAFFNEWKDDAVVFNKWLQVQAGSNQPDTFKQVQKISQTKPFSFDVPNNVYSLLRVFAENQLAMNHPSGETYAWLCDHILLIDPKNPQVAARLCGSFNFVKKLPEALKLKAQSEIKRVLSNHELSRNSRELLEGCV